MKSELIDYYVQPTTNNQPIDISSGFIALPPLLRPSEVMIDNNFVPYAPLYENPSTKAKKLNGGEIAGIVIGCTAFVVIVIAIIFLLLRRTQLGKIQSPGKKKSQSGVNVNSETTSVDRDYNRNNDTYKSDKHLIADNRKAKNDMNIGNTSPKGPNFEDDALPNIDFQNNDARRVMNPQARSEIPDRIANQQKFSYTSQDSEQQKQQVQQPKQLSAKYNSNNNSYSLEIDQPASPRGKNQSNNQINSSNQNIYAPNAVNATSLLKYSQPRPGSEDDGSCSREPVPTNSKPLNNKTKIEFPSRSNFNNVKNGSSKKLNDLPVQYPNSASYGPQKSYELSTPQDQNTNIENDSDLSYSQTQQTSLPRTYNDYEDEDDKLQRPRQISPDARQQNPLQQQSQQPTKSLPFKSLVKGQKSGNYENSATAGVQPPPPPTSRSYQGTPGLVQQYQSQVTKTRQQYIVERRTESSNIKDSATDV